MVDYVNPFVSIYEVLFSHLHNFSTPQRNQLFNLFPPS